MLTNRREMETRIKTIDFISSVTQNILDPSTTKT